MSVTVCLVTRNHEASIGRAIRSVSGFASEVVVGDTGSTDRTVATAEQLGAKVIAVAWADDFSAAQNSVIEASTGDWLFWLNPDEDVAADGVPKIQAAADMPGAFAHRVRVRQVTSPATLDTGIEDWDVRLVRRDPQVRFVGRLHPTFATPLAPLSAAKGQVIGNVDAVVHRHVYLSEPTPDKVRWVIRLLEAELKDRPGQLPLMIELGRNLLFVGDSRGHQVAADVAAVVKAQASSQVAPDPTVGMLLEYILNVPPSVSQCAISREEARELAARWFPETPPVVWAVAGERFQAGDYAAAARHLERLVQMGHTKRYDPAGGFAADIIGPAALLNLGGAYLHLERWDDARACFAQLFADPHRKADALRGFALAEQQKKPGA